MRDDQTHDPMSAASLNLLAYRGTHPRLASPPLHFGAGAALVGRVTLGADAWFGPGAVIRADGHDVRAGSDLHMGRRATVHIAHDVYPTLLGEHVTIGEYAVVHACEVGDGNVIEERAVVLDGSVLEPGVVLAADALVFPRSRLPGGFLYAGRPAKPQRPLADGELAQRRAALRARSAAVGHAAHPTGDLRATLPDNAFVANTATLRGDVALRAHASVWYGCDLDAEGGRIVIGERSNVQDNSLLRCGPGGRIEIGAETTIGHNVQMADCTIGARCLIGMGCVLASATRIDDDVFLAAGAATLPGQHLTGGRLWGGQPARALGQLDERKRAMIRAAIGTYCEYADELKRAQALAARSAQP
jgi:carbonic anhydrase/acetyltransferase-like protein (isoleucine patch superfamily)